MSARQKFGFASGVDLTAAEKAELAHIRILRNWGKHRMRGLSAACIL
jgi:hypothetical protein